MVRVTAALFGMTMFGALASAEPLSYDYAYLSHQQTHVDGQSFRNDSLGAYYQMGANFHLFGSFGNAGSYGNAAWKNSRAVRGGAGGHWLLGDDTMIAVEGAVMRAQFDKPFVGTVRDTGGSVIFEVRHRVAPWMEAIASTSHTDVLGRRTNEFVAGPVFHLNRTFALGAFYRHTEGSSGFEVTARTYY
ncbi:MAG: hypothetical protein ABI843_10420 [Dokdonella sp.]